MFSKSTRATLEKIKKFSGKSITKFIKKKKKKNKTNGFTYLNSVSIDIDFEHVLFSEMSLF